MTIVAMATKSVVLTQCDTAGGSFVVLHNALSTGHLTNPNRSFIEADLRHVQIGRPAASAAGELCKKKFRRGARRRPANG